MRGAVRRLAVLRLFEPASISREFVLEEACVPFVASLSLDLMFSWSEVRAASGLRAPETRPILLGAWPPSTGEEDDENIAARWRWMKKRGRRVEGKQMLKAQAWQARVLPRLISTAAMMYEHLQLYLLPSLL